MAHFKFFHGWRFFGRSEKHVLFWAQNIKMPFQMGQPPMCTSKPSLYVCRRAQGSQIFKQNSNISIRSHFIEFFKIWASSAPGGQGRRVEEYLETQKGSHTCTHTCVYICIHAHACNTKNYMLRNCKWPLPWRQPCLSWLTCMGMCVQMYVWICMNMYTIVGLTPPTLTSTQYPPPPRKGGTPWKQYKFNKSWTNWDKSILFAYLESV